MNQEDGYSLARAFVLVGGILAVALGAVALGAVASPYASLWSYQAPAFAIVLGIVALLTAHKVKDEPLDVILVVFGFLVGGPGGVVVAMGGMWAIVTRYALGAAAQPADEKQVQAEAV